MLTYDRTNCSGCHRRGSIAAVRMFYDDQGVSGSNVLSHSSTMCIRSTYCHHLHRCSDTGGRPTSHARPHHATLCEQHYKKGQSATEPAPASRTQQTSMSVPVCLFGAFVRSWYDHVRCVFVCRCTEELPQTVAMPVVATPVDRRL